MRWMFKKIRSIFLIPILSVALFTGFFYYYLSPVQRSIIFREILASIPGAKNLVNIHYKTHLNVTAVKDTKILKAAFYSVDYLSSIRNSQGHIYIAIYPFQIEAGFNLEDSNVSIFNAKGTDTKSLELTLPSPVITTLDLDEHKQVMVVRDNLNGDYDYVLRPVKKALELQARDYAIRNGIFDKAKKNAIEYYNRSFEGVYDEVNVIIRNGENKQFCEFKLQNLPIKFSHCKHSLGYDFYLSDSFQTYDGYFENKDSIIFAGYSKQSVISFRDLWKNVAENSSRKAIFKFIDPEAPLENGVVCEYDQYAGTCYTQKKGNLFYLFHRPSDAEQAKQTLSDLLYLSFNVQYDEPRQSEHSYFDFVKMLAEARDCLAKRRFAQLEKTALNILKIEENNLHGKLLLSVANTLNSKDSNIVTNSEKIDRLLKLYKLINNGSFQPSQKDFIDKTFSHFKDSRYNNFLNNFRSLLIMNSDKLKLTDEEVKNHIKSLAESGHLTYELIQRIPPELWTFALKVKIHQINDKLYSEGKTTGNMVFCKSDHENLYWGKDHCSSNIYYDLDAVASILNQGKATVSNRLNLIFRKFGVQGNPENYFVIVLTRSGLFFNDYDLFVFKKNLFYLIIDFMDDLSSENYVNMHYSLINPGQDILRLAGNNYRNTAFLTLINEIYEISKKSSRGTKENLLKFLKEEIIVETANSIWVPTVLAKK